MRNVALVLSGGTGDRMGGGTPKQYRTVAGKPVLVHTLERLERCSAIDGVFVIASPQWTDRILEWKEAFGLEKLLGAAPAGAGSCPSETAFWPPGGLWTGTRGPAL